MWVAQSVKHPTLDLNSGLDLRVVSSSPVLGCGAYLKTKIKKVLCLPNLESSPYNRNRISHKWYPIKRLDMYAALQFNFYQCNKYKHICIFPWSHGSHTSLYPLPSISRSLCVLWDFNTYIANANIYINTVLTQKDIKLKNKTTKTWRHFQNPEQRQALQWHFFLAPSGKTINRQVWLFLALGQRVSFGFFCKKCIILYVHRLSFF